MNASRPLKATFVSYTPFLCMLSTLMHTLSSNHQGARNLLKIEFICIIIGYPYECSIRQKKSYECNASSCGLTSYIIIRNLLAAGLDDTHQDKFCCFVYQSASINAKGDGTKTKPITMVEVVKKIAFRRVSTAMLSGWSTNRWSSVRQRTRQLKVRRKCPPVWTLHYGI